MNLGDKAKQILRTVAPLLGTAIGGPFGTMAGSLVSAALGTPEGDEEAAEAALLAASPDTLVTLRKAGQDFAVRMKELGIEESKLAFDDTANARAREVAVRDNTPRILAYLVVGATLIIEGYGALIGFPKVGDPVILGRILGTLDAASLVVLGYYFGTTAGSRHKDETIAEIAKMP